MLACASPSLRADTAAYVSTGTENDLGGFGISGVEFTLNMNIDVTQLGYTPLSLGGGDAPSVTVWQVGAGGALTLLYNTGDILGSVSSTGQGTSTGVFNYVPVSSTLTLTAGNTYLVSAPAYWAATYDSSGVTTAGGGVFSSTSFLKGGSWNGWDNSGYFTGAPNISAFGVASSPQTPSEANFQFTVDSVVVPEPSTYALLGAGFAFLVFHLRRRRADVVR
jgi:hypothetical protein